jgi:hypothetical protein
VPALLTLELHATEVPAPLPFLGEGVRAFLYDCLRDVRPDIGAELHGRDEYKPFALSEPQVARRRAGGAAPPEGRWQVRCGCLEDGLEDVLAEAIWRRHATEKEVRFGPARFRLADPPAAPR